MTTLLATSELLREPKKAKEIQNCTDVACGAEFTMWLCDGRLYSAGLPQYGQLGHGTDHEYNAKDCESCSTVCAVPHLPEMDSQC